jgi:hypothetical protein
MTAYHPPETFGLAAANDPDGASRRVPVAKAERPVSVQLADPRRYAREWARRADSGRSPRIVGSDNSTPITDLRRNVDIVIDVPVPGTICSSENEPLLPRSFLSRTMRVVPCRPRGYLPWTGDFIIDRSFWSLAAPAGARRQRIPVGPTQTVARCADGEGGVMVVLGDARSATRKADLTRPPNMKG